MLLKLCEESWIYSSDRVTCNAVEDETATEKKTKFLSLVR